MMIKEALALAMESLSASETPDIDSQFLLCYVLACKTSHLLMWPDKVLSPDEEQTFIDLVKQRQQGIPIAYLTGKRGFWSLDLSVTEDTLIPRPDTELIVEKSLAKMKSGMQVADLGTGTGAIALAIAVEKPEVTVFAMDASAQALAVASLNKAEHDLNNVQFWQGYWLSAIQDRSLDMVISNPPYIEAADPHLQQGDVRFEPITALASGDDGLDDIRQIIAQARRALKPNGWLLIEHGYQQGQAIRSLFEQQGFSLIQTYQDFGGNDRVTEGQLTL